MNSLRKNTWKDGTPKSSGNAFDWRGPTKVSLKQAVPTVNTATRVNYEAGKGNFAGYVKAKSPTSAN